MELIDSKLIQLHVEVDDWKQAIIAAAQPLINQGKITIDYPRRVIEIAQETGPYIVISPHVALPHASSTDGVISDAIGLTVLDTPVEFGNEANDPVKYLFTVCSTDPNGHLEQMAQLVDLLQRSDLFDVLDSATDVDEVAKYINGK